MWPNGETGKEVKKKDEEEKKGGEDGGQQYQKINFRNC